MDIDSFRNIVGEARQGAPALIRFFGKITESSTAQFNAEFEYLNNIVKPSLIRVLINSEGGSVLYGMTSYSTIQNSSVPTECIVEGMAASMGSVIWAAGDKSLMRDYGILMIHNPGLPSPDDEAPSELVLAFTRQIETIYRKRFGLTRDKIRAIMDGEGGNDGTFFDAASAVRAGIIPAENILRTSRQLCDRVKNELSSLKDMSDIQSMMTRISGELSPSLTENKHFHDASSNLNQTDTKMNDEKTTVSPEYGAVAAALGMKDKHEVRDVMARISELVAVENRLKDTTKALSDAQTVIAGKDATIANLQTNVGELTASLKVFKDKEALDKKTRNENMVKAAKVEGKINDADEAKWLEMAEANPDLTESILAAIPAREQISQEIASDPANIQAAAETAKTVEDKIAEKVKAVVGEQFEFKKIG